MFEPDVLKLAAVVTAFMEWLRIGLAKLPFWSRFDELTQSIILQLIAFAAGALGASVQGINAFPAADPVLATILTGMIAALDSAGIHVILSLLGIRAGVSGETQTAGQHMSAQSADEPPRYSRTSYLPFM